MKSIILFLLLFLSTSVSIAQLGRADISIIRGSVAQNAPPVYTDGWIMQQLAQGDLTIASSNQAIVIGGQGRIFIDNDAEIGWNTTSTLTIHALYYFKSSGNSPNNPNATQWLLNPSNGGNIILRSDGTQPVNVLIVDDQVGVDLSSGRIISTKGDVEVYGIAGFTFGTNYGVKMLDTEIRLSEGEFYVQGDAQQANTASYGIHVTGSGVDIVVEDGQMTYLGNVFNTSRPSIGVLIQGDLDITGLGDTDIILVAQVAGGSGTRGLVVTDQASISTELGDVQVSSMLSNDADNLTGIQFSNQSYLSGHLLTMTSEIGNVGSNHTAILLDNSVYSFQSNVYLYGLSQAQGDFLLGIILRNNTEITTPSRIELIGNTNVGGEQCVGVMIHNSPRALSSTFEDIIIHGISPSMGEHGVGVWIAQNLQQATFPLSMQGSAPSPSGDAVIKTLNGPISITGNAGAVPASKYGVLITDGSLIHAVNNHVMINGTTETMTPSPPGTASLLVQGSTIVTGDPQDPQVSGDIELSAGESQSYDKFVLANARIETLSSGDVHLSSSDDMIFSDDTMVRSNSGKVTIVVDSRFLTSQNPGPGGFYTSTASSIEAFGEIRAYTHRRPNNQVLGKIAGLDFIPGIEFLDTASEQWNISYPNGTYSGHPFKIYYHEAGQAQIVSVSGYKFDDLNGNSVKNQNEPFLSGFTFYADLNANEQFDQGEPSAVSDVSGFFEITNIPAGTFLVREVMQFAWQQTTPIGGLGNDGLSVEVTLSAGQSKDDLLFGNRNLFAPQTSGNISGLVWNDLNKNGQQDQGEPVLQGWVAYIDSNDNGQLDQGEPFSVSNANGVYLFDNLPFQNYIIRVNVMQGWEQTSPPQQADFKHAHLLNANAPNATNLNFGVSELPVVNPYVSVSGTVYRDVNTNGIRDTGESGIQGVMVYIDANMNDWFDNGELNTLTNANGYFQIDQIPEGTFRVRAELGSTWIQTTPENAHGNDGLAFELTLAAGEQNNDLLFGLIDAPEPVGPGSLSGYIYYNFSIDEFWQDWKTDQPGMNMVSVRLDRVSPTGHISTITTSTDADGRYQFDNLEEGEYWVYLDQSAYTPIYPENIRPSLSSTESQVAYRILLEPGQHLGIDRSTYSIVPKIGTNGWLGTATARTDTLVSTIALWVDVDKDGTPDERIMLTGSMVINQATPSTASGHHISEIRLLSLNMSGWSEHYGDLKARLNTGRISSGIVSQSFNSDTAYVELDLDVVLYNQNHTYTSDTSIELGGTTIRMPFINGRLLGNVDTSPAIYRNVFGVVAFRMHHIQLIAQFGTDLGVIRADFGDAPQSYGTLLRPESMSWRLDGDVLRRHGDGARHIQTYIGAPTLYLGSNVITETDGKPSSDASADNDDGLTPVPLTRGVEVTIPISIVGSGYLTIWSDYNGSGSFNDQSGVVLRDAQVSTGVYTFSYTPSYLIPGDVNVIRIRLARFPGVKSTGPVLDGEVEDYVFEVTPLASVWTVSGLVYDDINGNNNWEADEAGVEGLRVFWDMNGNRSYEIGEPFSITDDHGNYELTSGLSGMNEIIVETNSNWSLPTGFVFPKISLSPGVISGAMFPLRRLATNLIETEMSREFKLISTYPNPFNPSTMIYYSIASSNDVVITVYDMLGREVRRFNRGMQVAGTYNFEFVANNLNSGVYLIRLQSGNAIETVKVSLIK